MLVDHSRQWLPGEWVGGTLTYGGVHFPIEGNTAQRIVVAGDLTSVGGSTYQLTLPDIARVQQYLQSRAITVEVTYTRCRPGCRASCCASRAMRRPIRTLATP